MSSSNEPSTNDPSMNELPTSHPPSDANRTDTPEFDLDCLYDDPADPSELTIFPSDIRQSVTEWITADRSTTVPLDRIR